MSLSSGSLRAPCDRIQGLPLRGVEAFPVARAHDGTAASSEALGIVGRDALGVDNVHQNDARGVGDAERFVIEEEFFGLRVRFFVYHQLAHPARLYEPKELLRDPGWEPAVTLADCLAKTYEWAEERPSTVPSMGPVPDS